MTPEQESGWSAIDGPFHCPPENLAIKWSIDDPQWDYRWDAEAGVFVVTPKRPEVRSS